MTSLFRKFFGVAIFASLFTVSQLQAATSEQIQQSISGAQQWLLENIQWVTAPDGNDPGTARFILDADGGFPSSSNYLGNTCSALAGLADHDSAGQYTEFLTNLKAHFLNNQVDGKLWYYSVTQGSTDLSTGQHAVMGIFFANERLGLSETTDGDGHTDTDGQPGAPYTDWPDRVLTGLEANRAGNQGKGFYYQGNSSYTGSRSMTGAGLWTLFMIGEARRLAEGDWENPLVPQAIDRLYDCFIGQSLNGWDTTSMQGCGAFGQFDSQDYIYPYMFFAVSKALGVLVGSGNPLLPSDAVFNDADSKYYVGNVAPENEVMPLAWSDDFTNAALPFFTGGEFSGACASGFARCTGTPGIADFRTWWLDTGGQSSQHGDALATGWMLMSLAFANANAPAVVRFDEPLPQGCDGQEQIDDGIVVCIPDGGEAEEIPAINAPVTLRSGNGRTLISSLSKLNDQNQEVAVPMRERIVRRHNPRKINLPAGALNFRLTLAQADTHGEFILDFDRDPLATVACDPDNPNSFVVEENGNLVLKQDTNWFKLTSQDFWEAVAEGDAEVTLQAARDNNVITTCRLLVSIRDNGAADKNPAVGVIDDPGAPGGGAGGGGGAVSLGGTSGGGCAIDPTGRFDPTLPALLLLGLAGLGWRRATRH